MAFVAQKENFPGKVYEVSIGSEKPVVFGGQNVLPFHSFEGVTPNRPLIAHEIQDIVPDDWPEAVSAVYKNVSHDPALWAKFCQDELNAKAIALRLIGTHPDREDRSPDQAAQTVKDVLAAINVPLMILGSNSIEKDGPVIIAAAEAAKGRNCIIGKAQEANYKTIAAAAMANNHKLIAMSELDVNLAKQLNILTSQIGLDKERIVTDPMCSALGYGIEYTYSVSERIRLAALAQNDPAMQQPMLGDVGMHAWKVKEAAAPEAEVPLWGAERERGIAWEVVTAGTVLLAGADILIMRHPEAIAAVEKFIDELFNVKS
jgi:acetyl-CoA decarbonylase/synthase, CODH/ACS complex subunit delta